MRLSLMLVMGVGSLLIVPVPRGAAAAPVMPAAPQRTLALADGAIQDIYYYHGRYYPYRYQGRYYKHRNYRHGRWHYY